MNRKLVTLALVSLMLLIVAGPVLAAPPEAMPGQQYFTLVGFIREVNVDADGNGTITVDVVHGNRFVKPDIGDEKSVQVTDGTTYRKNVGGYCIPLTDPIEEYVNHTVSIHGTVADGGAYEASRVTVDVPLDCCTP